MPKMVTILIHSTCGVKINPKHLVSWRANQNCVTLILKYKSTHLNYKSETICCKSEVEADNLVNKINDYFALSAWQRWRTNIISA